MNSIIRDIEKNLKIPQKNIHIYVFVDERSKGWGTEFLKKAEIQGSKEQGCLLDAVDYCGRELYNAGRLTIVMPDRWMSVFRIINRDSNTLRPSLNFIAEEYLMHYGIITEYLPEKKKQVDWSLDNADNFLHVEYYVDISNHRILPKRFHSAPPNPYMKVIGIGGFGGRVAERMMAMNITGVDYVTITSDRHAAEQSICSTKIYLGENGISEPNEESVCKYVEECREKIEDALFGTDLVFLIAGIGGITGETAMPIIAGIAESIGVENICVVTMPLPFEGEEKFLKAMSTYDTLEKEVKSLRCVLGSYSDSQGRILSVQEAFDTIELDVCKHVEKLINGRKEQS